YAYIAHPDLINFTGSKRIYIKEAEFMLSELKRLDVPVEFNFLGFTDKRNYPNDTFWRLAAEIGNRVVIGLDAHSPDVYGDKKRLGKMKKKIASLGITPIENVNDILK
ncbi:MAG: hypothetical protein K6C14_00505, partial [Eubacterium sp.]|nr:hypothetical protein [Eubacterium sp.]